MWNPMPSPAHGVTSNTKAPNRGAIRTQAEAGAGVAATAGAAGIIPGVVAAAAGAVEIAPLAVGVVVPGVAAAAGEEDDRSHAGEASIHRP